MKFNTLVLSSSLLLLTACASQSVDLGADTKSSATSALSDVAGTLQNNLLAGYAAKQLGLPEGQATAALGAVFKTAKSNLSTEDFASIGGSIPGLDSIIEQAPAVAGFDLASSLGGQAQSGANLGYLDAAFEQIGVPKETVLPLVSTLTGYLDQNNMSSAAAMLKQGLNFL